MKKLICILIVAALCFSLCACDPGTHTISPDALDNVISVELIEYENPNQKHYVFWIYLFKELVPFSSDNATVLKTLPEDEIPNFLADFENTDILSRYCAYNSPKDICLRLNYVNGDFLIIWANYSSNGFAGYIGEYTADGSVLSFWGSFSALAYYTDLVNQYFDYELS